MYRCHFTALNYSTLIRWHTIWVLLFGFHVNQKYISSIRWVNSALSFKTRVNFCLLGWLVWFVLFFFFFLLLLYVSQCNRRRTSKNTCHPTCQAVSTFHWQLKEFEILFFYTLSFILSIIEKYDAKMNEKPFSCNVYDVMSFDIFFSRLLQIAAQQNMIHTVDVIYFCQLKLIRFEFLGKYIYISISCSKSVSSLANYRGYF